MAGSVAGGMRAVRYHDHGGPEVLQLDDVAMPDPGPDEVLVSVHAAGVNPVDTYFRAGAYSPGSLPWIPGSDLAGVVETTGEGVSRLHPGDRVFGTGLGRDRPGTYAEACVAPESLLAPLPDGVDFTEGAALALVGVTAWRALIDHAGLEPAERCLVHGGAGGVGHVAVQLAAAVGAETTATAAPAYHNRLAGLGADRVLDYDREDLAEAVAKAGGPDVILDHRCDDYLGLDAEVAAHAARIVGIGQTDPAVTLPAFAAARAKELQLYLMSMFNTPDIGAVLRRLGRLADAGVLTAAVERVFDLDDAAEAQRAVLEESFLGKLVLEP